LDRLVNGVVDRLAGRLGKRSGIFILASPGCSRGRLVTVLLRRGLVDVVYAYAGFGSKVGDDVRGRVIEFSSVDELAGKLDGVNGRVAVVARSTTDAVRLRDRLGNAEVIYLPKYYKDAAKKVLRRRAPKVARVRHEGLGEGISPSLLREDVSSKDVESIRELSPGKVGFGDLIKDILNKEGKDNAAQAIKTFLSLLPWIGVAVDITASTVRIVEEVVDRWKKNKDEVLGGFVRLLRAAREVKNYLCDEQLCDERLEAVFDEVAYEWGLNIKEFTTTITNIANITKGKLLTEEDIKKIINENLERIEKELDKVKNKVNEQQVSEKGQKIGVKVFFIDDLESGLLYGNFIVKDGVPKIKTWVGTARNEQNKQSELEPLETDLVDVGEFRKVAEDVFSKLVNNGRVVLIGPRGIGKSTLATYVTWRSLRGSLGSVVLDKPMDAVIRVDSLNPGDALNLNNLVEDTKRRFVVIYDPSPIKAYYKPEAMQVVMHGTKSDENITLRELIEIVKNTLKELMEVRNAWVVIILPRELYEQVQRGKEEDVDLRQVLDNLERDVVTVNLRDEGFLREIIKRYSGCDNVSDDLVSRVKNFDSYTFVAKYAGISLRERKCKVEDVDKALRESADKPKLFFAHYMWGIILGKSTDLAKKVSVPLILHATFGPIPKGITYITKAAIESGEWKLIDRDRLAKSKLEDLREADLEPIAKWLSTEHEDLVEETLDELVGLRGEEARKHYIDHGFKDFIEALDGGFKKALEEVAPGESSVEEFMKNLVKKSEQFKADFLKALFLLAVKANFLSIFVSKRLKNALKPYANCLKRAALIIGLRLGRYVSVPRPEDLPEDLFEHVAESLGDALRRCSIDDYLLIGNEMPPLIQDLIEDHALVLAEAFIDKYSEAVAEINKIFNIFRIKGGHYDIEELYGLGLVFIIARAAEMGMQIEPSDADVILHIASFLVRDYRHSLSDYIIPILPALKPLRDKAPDRYIQLLNFASNIKSYDLETIEYIFHELNEVLDKYGQSIEGHAYSLVYAINTYAVLLNGLNAYFKDEVGGVYDRIADQLNKLGRLNSVLGIIVWAYALAPVLPVIVPEHVRELMAKKLGVNVVDKAIEVLKELDKLELEKNVQELMGDKEFMSFVESIYLKADERAVRKTILDMIDYLNIKISDLKLYGLS